MSFFKNLFKKPVLKRTVDNSGNVFNYLFQQGEDCDQVNNAYGEFGKEPTNPIPVNGPRGEILYLNQLRDETNSPILFHRITYTEVAGLTEAVDVFEIVNLNGQKWDILYFHMYHPKNSSHVPNLFKFTNSGSLFANLSVGLGISEFVNNFPKGLSTVINRFYGNIADLSKTVTNLTANNQYIRPQTHLQRLLQVNNANKFFDSLVIDLASSYPDNYFVNLLKSQSMHLHILAHKVAQKKKSISKEYLNEISMSTVIHKDPALIDLAIKVISSKNRDAHIALKEINHEIMWPIYEGSNLLEMLNNTYGLLAIPYLLTAYLNPKTNKILKKYLMNEVERLIYTQ